MSDTAPIEHPTWLTSGDFTEADEPLRLFQAWFDEAVKSEPRDPNAMSLATVDADGMPDVRTVLLKGIDERGFVFYTNTESQKGRELGRKPESRPAVLLEIAQPPGARPRAGRARDAGGGRRLFRDPPEAGADRRLGEQAVAPLESRLAFEKAVALYAAKYALGTVPRPPHWSGYPHRADQDRVLARPAFQTT